MDDRMLDVIDNLIDSRNTFFERLGQINHAQRPTLVSRFMLNEVCYLEIMNRMYQNSLRQQVASTLLSFTVPITGSNFSDPVPVVATQQQINASLIPVNGNVGNCAICQEAISSSGVMLRQCQHNYHRACILNWLSMSVRCPVCRHDIREEDHEEDPGAQTPSDEE